MKKTIWGLFSRLVMIVFGSNLLGGRFRCVLVGGGLTLMREASSHKVILGMGGHASLASSLLLYSLTFEHCLSEEVSVGWVERGRTEYRYRDEFIWQRLLRNTCSRSRMVWASAPLPPGPLRCEEREPRAPPRRELAARRRESPPLPQMGPIIEEKDKIMYCMNLTHFLSCEFHFSPS